LTAGGVAFEAVHGAIHGGQSPPQRAYAAGQTRRSCLFWIPYANGPRSAPGWLALRSVAAGSCDCTCRHVYLVQKAVPFVGKLSQRKLKILIIESRAVCQRRLDGRSTTALTARRRYIKRPYHASYALPRFETVPRVPLWAIGVGRARRGWSWGHWDLCFQRSIFLYGGLDGGRTSRRGKALFEDLGGIDASDEEVIGEGIGRGVSSGGVSTRCHDGIGGVGLS